MSVHKSGWLSTSSSSSFGKLAGKDFDSCWSISVQRSLHFRIGNNENSLSFLRLSVTIENKKRFFLFVRDFHTEPGIFFLEIRRVIVCLTILTQWISTVVVNIQFFIVKHFILPIFLFSKTWSIAVRVVEPNLLSRSFASFFSEKSCPLIWLLIFCPQSGQKALPPRKSG